MVEVSPVCLCFSSSSVELGLLLSFIFLDPIGGVLLTKLVTEAILGQSLIMSRAWRAAPAQFFS